MKITEIAIKRPIFITCIIILMIITGVSSLMRLPVDQFPNVSLPFESVSIIYPGAGPEEMANLVARPLEEQIRTISGVDKVYSYSASGYAAVWAEFKLESDPLYADQQIRDAVARAKSRLPKGIEEPDIRRFSFADKPVYTLALQGPGSPVELFETADKIIKPQLESIPQVSSVDILGGSKREIEVILDRKKLADYEISVGQVAQSLEMSGENVPIGSRPDTRDTKKQWSYRSLGEFNSIEAIKSVLVRFYGNDVPLRLDSIAKVTDSQKEQTSYAYFNGKPVIQIDIHRQSGANTVEVGKRIKKKLKYIRTIMSNQNPGYSLEIARDGSRFIKANVLDVTETILIGIFLTILVVFFFLGNVRSTLITAAAIPNSLIGAFILVGLFGFTVNILTLLALSLSVGLLIDDSIVVRENIFRHIELGKPPKVAALEATAEVGLAVIATTFAILSVFGPIAFLKGIIGQFMKEFGLTVCFIMVISLLDSLTIGPMLSALWYKDAPAVKKKGFVDRIWNSTFQKWADAFGRFQDRLEEWYGRLSNRTLNRPGTVLLIGSGFFLLSLLTLLVIPKTFLPPMETGEILLNMEMPAGSSLAFTRDVVKSADELIRTNPEIKYTKAVAGNASGDTEMAEIFLQLKDKSKRKLTTLEFKDKLREQLKDYRKYRLTLTEYNPLFMGERSFSFSLVSTDPDLLQKKAQEVLDLVKTNPKLKEPDMSFRPGKPELRLIYNQTKVTQYGVSTLIAGGELRNQVEGIIPAKFREQGEEWDIRVRLDDADRDLKNSFGSIRVPNMNYRLVSLSDIAVLEEKNVAASVSKLNAQRYVTISADLARGVGLGDMLKWVRTEIEKRKILPPEVQIQVEGEAQQFGEMMSNMIMAIALAVLFIYLVLSSLYESFLLPLVLIIPLPFAFSGALVALFVGRQSLNLYSFIAIIMVLGIATKNSILLIDYTNQLRAQGMELKEALIKAGRTRLRPILMTSMTLIAGTLPLAIGLNEASRQRACMGYVIIGGIITSTPLTLVMVPAVLSFLTRLKARFKKKKAAGA
jgi:hydrophobic/amphiphilic exporter-1 (mainly G- bacteria), HAE1 family